MTVKRYANSFEFFWRIGGKNFTIGIVFTLTLAFLISSAKYATIPRKRLSVREDGILNSIRWFIKFLRASNQRIKLKIPLLKVSTSSIIKSRFFFCTSPLNLFRTTCLFPENRFSSIFYSFIRQRDEKIRSCAPNGTKAQPIFHSSD